MISLSTCLGHSMSVAGLPPVSGSLMVVTYDKCSRVRVTERMGGGPCQGPGPLAPPSGALSSDIGAGATQSQSSLSQAQSTRFISAPR